MAKIIEISQPPRDDSPYFYLICKGDPVWITRGGNIAGVDAEKAQFVGRPEDHAVIALASDLWNDQRGKSAGRALGGVPDTSPGAMLFSMTYGREGPFENNSHGVKDFTIKARNTLAKYWIVRWGGVESTGEKAVDDLYKYKKWDGDSENNVNNVYKNRTKSVLESPESQ